MVVELESAGLQPIHEYIWRQQVNIAAQVACSPIYELCTKAGHIPGTIHIMVWWDHNVVHESEEYTGNMCNLT